MITSYTDRHTRISRQKLLKEWLQRIYVSLCGKWVLACANTQNEWDHFWKVNQHSDANHLTLVITRPKAFCYPTL